MFTTSLLLINFLIPII